MPRSSSKLHQTRSVILSVWVLTILALFGIFLFYPEHFAPQRIAERLREYEAAALWIFLGLSMVRGFTLLPSTPLIIAGTLQFPHLPWLVLLISIVGIVVSSGMIYWLSDALGISNYFESKMPRHVDKIRSRLEHPAGLLFVVLWGFFPLVPTDAVCYVAGSIRMNFTRFIIAIVLGEFVLCSIYIFSGRYLVQFVGV